MQTEKEAKTEDPSPRDPAEASVEAAVEPVQEEPASEAPLNIQRAKFDSIEPTPGNGKKEKRIELLLDLTLPVSIELGRTNMLIRDILELQRGSVVEFEKLASEPVDVLINGRKMAEGEVVVIEKHFGIRITNLIDTPERVKNLGK